MSARTSILVRSIYLLIFCSTFGVTALSGQNPTVIDLPQAMPGAPYAVRLTIPPGLGYPFNCQYDPLPDGMTFDCDRLQFGGRVPLSPEKKYQFALVVADDQGNKQTFMLALLVSAKPIVVSVGTTVPVSAKETRLAQTRDVAGEMRRSSRPQQPEATPQVQWAPSPNADRQRWSQDTPDSTEQVAQDRRDPSRINPSQVERVQRGDTAASDGADSDAGAPEGQDANEQKTAGDKTVSVTPEWISTKRASATQLEVVECTPLTLQVTVHPAVSGNVTLNYIPPAGKKAADKPTPVSVNIAIDKGTGKGKSTIGGLGPGNYTFKVTGFSGTDSYYVVDPAPPTLQLILEKAATPLPNCPYRMPPLLSTVVGVDVEGASSTSPAARFMGNASIDLPVFPAMPGSERLTDIERAKVFIGGSLRIAAMAQPGALSSSAFTQGYFASAINATPDKIVQSWEGNGSVSFKLSGTNLGFGTFDTGSPTSKNYPRKTLLTTSFLLSGGFVSPLSASQANPPVYYATNQIQSLYPNEGWGSLGTSCAYTSSNPPCYVAFVPTDRTRFYKHYEAGLRWRIYGEDFNNNVLRFPGILDLTVGQNEYVTAGKLNGVVVHFGGLLPVPIPKVDGIYAFGSLDSEVNGPVGGGAQLLLTPVPSTANVTYLSPSVYTIPVAQPNRDRYRFGIGVDLYHLLTAKAQKQGTSNASTTEASKQ